MFFIKQVEGITAHLEPQVQVAFPNLALEDQLLPSMLEREVTQSPALSENQCEEQRDLKSFFIKIYVIIKWLSLKKMPNHPSCAYPKPFCCSLWLTAHRSSNKLTLKRKAHLRNITVQ